MTDETEKRRQLQLTLLREGYTQDNAREAAAKWPLAGLDEEWVQKMHEDAKRFPERQILPPGSIDLADVKSQREDAEMEAEEQVYYAKRDKLAEQILESFSTCNMCTPTLLALSIALQESKGISLLESLEEIIKEANFLLRFNSDIQLNETEQS
jgi:hypothetical protein